MAVGQWRASPPFGHVVRFTRTKGVPARLSHVMNGIAIDVLIRSL